MSIIPKLHVRNFETTLQFYLEKLGFELQWHDDTEQGQLASISIGDDSIFLAESTQYHDNTGELVIVVDDVLQVESKMRNKVSIVSELELRDGFRQFSVTDCNGFRITFASVINVVGIELDGEIQLTDVAEESTEVQMLSTPEDSLNTLYPEKQFGFVFHKNLDYRTDDQTLWN